MKSMVIHYTDDDTEDIEMFKKAVEKSRINATLHTYSNGDDFLHAIKNERSPEAIVLLDINMPGKSGFEVLKEMRHVEALKKLPVVIYSTSSDVNAILTSKDIGATMYAVKPGSFAELKTLINKIIEVNWDKFESPPEDFVINGKK